ncbi:MAG: right-handed parallel beta-helix repeat-containing protein, partial [Phycisphaerales bacterium]|nr:right-handed parallel beta-helix repeat-containing protein [Phycisphaerales bacterium]
MPLRFMILTAGVVLSLLGSQLAFATTTYTVCPDGCHYTSIQDAIDASSDGDVIQLQAGTYFEGEVIDTLNKAITILGAEDSNGNPLSIIDGDNTHRVLQCVGGEDDMTVFENLVIRNGNASGGWPDMLGGGMYNSNFSSPTLDNCTFTGNSAFYGGGGMYNEGISNPRLDNCTFENNSAYYGGGMYNKSSPILTDCTFTDNSAVFDGGGMYNYGSSSPTLTNTIVCSNTPDQVVGSIHNVGDNCIADSCGGCDFDDDGVDNDNDWAPLDPDETADSDGDGIGDNGDSHPNDFDN